MFKKATDYLEATYFYLKKRKRKKLSIKNLVSWLCHQRQPHLVHCPVVKLINADCETLVEVFDIF
jgi:hypothetical protein